MSFRYVLQRHWWRGQIVIRFGPSSQHYDLRLLYPDGKTEHYVLQSDPRRGPTLGYLEPMRDRVVETTDGRKLDVFQLKGMIRLKPGTPANPTKQTPAFLETLEAGEGEWLEEDALVRKARLGKTAFFFRREEPDSPFWEVSPSEGPRLTKMRPPFGASGGKRFVAQRIASLIPPHRIYVEPFAGAASVLFAKERSPVEVLNDRAERIVFLLRYLRDAPEAELRELGRRRFPMDRRSYIQFAEEEAQGKRVTNLERAFRLLTLARMSYHRMSDVRPSKYAPSNLEKPIGIDEQDLLRWKERLNGVKILHGDGVKLIQRLDGEDVFFFIDPPYLGRQSFSEGFGEEDWRRLVEALRKAKGKFLLALNGQTLRAIRELVPRSWRLLRIAAPGARLHKPRRYELFLANFSPLRRQEIAKEVPILKADPERQIVYGIVLKPNEPDAHGDVFSPEEIERAAHAYLERSRLFDWHHRRILSPAEVAPVESYIAPEDLRIGGKLVPAGSWILAAHVADPKLWQAVRSGEVRSFSIRGFGVRKPR